MFEPKLSYRIVVESESNYFREFFASCYDRPTVTINADLSNDSLSTSFRYSWKKVI